MTGQPPKPAIKANLPYLCSFNFLAKLLEIGCTLATLILALAFEGDGAIICIEIVSVLVLVTAASWVFLYCFNANARFPEFFSLLMFIYHLVMLIMMVIVMVCAAVLWPQFQLPTYPQYVACTFIGAVAAFLFMLDTIHNFMWWRGSTSEIVVFPCSPVKPEIEIVM